MIRQNKKLLLLTSVITLLPVFIGLFLWNQLPDSVATHFGLNNQPGRIFIQSLCSLWPASDSAGMSLVCVVCNKH